MRRCSRLAGIGLLAAAMVLAQPSSAQRGVVVRGEISSSAPIVGTLTVELESNGSASAQSTVVNPDGTFEFRYASPGAYDLRVTALGGATIHQEFVNIGGPNQVLSIRLPDRAPSASRSADSTISLQQLNHKIPPQAQKAFTKGQQAVAKGNQQQAAEYFHQAVTVDPEFVDAYNELGAAEASLGELPQAAEEFQKAIDLVPEHRLALPNLSIVLAKMKRFREAADVARRALKVVPGACKIQYVLAASLIAEHGYTDEALDNMQRAAAEIPRAHLVAADLLVERGRRQDAVRQLEEYLRTASANDAERTKVEARLAELQH
jgi:tetratricopeptide (TPR) repeat protein